MKETSQSPGREAGAANDLSKLPRNAWAVTLTSFLTDISSEMLFNLLPIFLFSVLGVRTAFIGLIEGLADAAASLLKMVSGWLSDRLGARKPLAVLGYAVSTVAKPFLYLATSWPGVLAIRFADRVGKGLRTAPRDALVADSVDEESRGIAFGLHRAGDTAGAVVGIAAAMVILASSGGATGELSRRAFQGVVVASVIPAALAVLILSLGAREVRRTRILEAAQAPGSQAAESEARLGREFRRYLLLMVIFTLGNSSDAFLILRARVAGLSVLGVLGMMLSFNLVYALVSIPAGVLSDRVGRKRLLVGGWLFYALVYMGFWRAQAGWQAWVLMLLYGVYYGLTEGVARAYVADLVPAEKRGTAYGALHTAVGLTALPASLIAGVLWQGLGGWGGFGQGAPFLFGSLMALSAAAGLASLVPGRGLPAREGA